MKFQILRITCILSVLLGSASFIEAQPKVILKLDDLGSKNGASTAESVLNVLLQRKIKAALGLIAASLDSNARNEYHKYLIAQNDKGEKLFEFWNHGYDHSDKNQPNNSKEFGGTTYTFQADHLIRSSKRVEDLLGIKMHTFNPPYNSSDTTFNKVIAVNGQYDRLFFIYNSTYLPKRIKTLNNRLNMEIEPGDVNYNFFVEQYTKYASQFKDYIVLQGHPNQWNAGRLAEFSKILDYLIAYHSQFILPHDPSFN